jgi:hypothetical protein
VALRTIDINILENRERSLIEPLWENVEMSTNARTVQQVKKQPEMSKVVKVKGRLALAPKSWVKKHAAVVADEDYAADVQLSSTYEELDDADAIDE